jgi:hypothetical protein
VGSVERESSGAAAPPPAVSYIDIDGRPTDDPAAAVSGEIAEFDHHGRPRRLTRFFLDEEALPWLPVSEAAFLLWVLIALIVGWLVVGLILGLV